MASPPGSPLVGSGNDSEEEISLSGSHSETDMSATSMKSELSVGKNELENWGSQNVKDWLINLDLLKYWKVFEEEGWVSGEDLLKVNYNDLLSASQTKFKNKKEITEEQIKLDCKKILREISKLRENEYDDAAASQLSPDDIFEFERRLDEFTKKWARIEWIEEYVEDWDGRLPTEEKLEEELDIPNAIAVDLLSTYQDKDIEEEGDLLKLFEGFNISDHGVIWWSIVLGKLVIAEQDSLWTILRYILRDLSTVICVRLLHHFRFELSTFPSIELDKLCQAIVYGSKYPICTAVRLAGYMTERGENDLSRKIEFIKLSHDYAKLGIHLLNEYTESDHLAAVLLEMKSDIDGGLSAIDLALKYRVVRFIADKRVSRISQSLFRQWRFLHPSNRESAFKIRPLGISELWFHLRQRSFYFTPLGLYASETLLFVFFLTLFCVVSSELFTVYDPFTYEELALWFCNIGYTIFEIWDCISHPQGIKGYFSDWTNWFDSLLVTIFCFMGGLRYGIWLSIRYTACSIHLRPLPVGDEYCGKDSWPNLLFTILWSISAILLWLRMLQIFSISRTVGPFIKMMGNLTQDLIAFLQIFLLFTFAFVFACLFLTVDAASEEFGNLSLSILTIFRASIGEYPFLEDISYSSGEEFRYVAINILIVLWMLVGTILLLNLLIALMAKTFSDLSELNNQQVLFSMTQRAYELDSAAAVMPPPLNLVVFITALLFIICDFITTLICHRGIPVRYLQPIWLRREGKKSNLLGLGGIVNDDVDSSDISNVFSDLRFLCICCKIFKTEEENEIEEFNKQYLKNDSFKKDNNNTCCSIFNKAHFTDDQPFDWVCTFCRQRTLYDNSHIRQTESVHKSFSALTTIEEEEKEKRNSQAQDPVQRLGDRLGLETKDIVNVRRLQPILCNKCYRFRKPSKRIAIIFEMISYWYFTFGLRLLLMIIVYPLYLIISFFDQNGSTLKSLAEQYNLTEKELQSQIDCIYEKDVIAIMPKSKEIRKLFDKNVIWALVQQSKNELLPRSVRIVVDRNILLRTNDRDYQLFEFEDILCGRKKLLNQDGSLSIVAKGSNEWKKMKYMAKLMFNCILNSTNDMIHLSHTRLFPFSWKQIGTYIENTLTTRLNEQLQASGNPNANEIFDMSKFNESHLREFLEILNIHNPNEKTIMIKEIRIFGNDNSEFRKHSKTLKKSLYSHFMFFLKQVKKLLGQVRRIENMIRDIEDCAKSHGEDGEIYLSHFHLVFEDIQNDAVAIAIFRSIDPKAKKISYQRVKAFLLALKQMRNNCDRELLEKSRYTQVTKEEFLNIVLRRVKNRDDDSDDDDSSDDDAIRNDTEKQKQQIEAIRTEAIRIFDKIWEINSLKVTLTQIREYILSLGEDCNDADVIKFIKYRILKYIKSKNNNYNSKKERMTIELFKNIIQVNEDEFEDEKEDINNDNEAGNTFLSVNKANSNTKSKQRTKLGFKLRDEDDIPNIANVEELFNSLKKTYENTDIKETRNRKYMTVFDSYTITSILFNILVNMINEIRERAHDLELDQDTFVKTMEKSLEATLTSDYNYDKPYYQWTDVARQSANIYQQVHDEEQGKITLGQVRETLTWIKNDITSLCSYSRLYKKLNKRRNIDEMVDFYKFWQFLINEVKIFDDSHIAKKRKEKGLYGKGVDFAHITNKKDKKKDNEKKDNNTRIERTNTLDNEEENDNNNNKEKINLNKLTNFERAQRLFSLIEDQNGLWITMRQMHVYILWLTRKFKKCKLDWGKYRKINDSRLKLDEFMNTILESLYDKNDVRKSLWQDNDNNNNNNKGNIDLDKIESSNKKDEFASLETAMSIRSDSNLATKELLLDALNNPSNLSNADSNKYGSGSEAEIKVDIGGLDDAFGDEINEKKEKDELMEKIKYHRKLSGKELSRLYKLWNNKDIKLFSDQLKWIFEQCAYMDIATDVTSTWKTCVKFIEPIKDGKIEALLAEDLPYLTGNKGIYRDEFEQFKADFNCPPTTAISLFYQIRNFADGVSWEQMFFFMKFLDEMLDNIEKAIDHADQELGEDEDPTLEEFQSIMNIPHATVAEWLFNVIISRHSSKVTWIELREYLIDWNEQRDEVAQYFEELIEQRDRTKLVDDQLKEIQKQIEKMNEYFINHTQISRESLTSKTKDELVKYIETSKFYSAKKKEIQLLELQQKLQKEEHKIKKAKDNKNKGKDKDKDKEGFTKSELKNKNKNELINIIINLEEELSLNLLGLNSYEKKESENNYENFDDKTKLIERVLMLEYIINQFKINFKEKGIYNINKKKNNNMLGLDNNLSQHRSSNSRLISNLDPILKPNV